MKNRTNVDNRRVLGSVPEAENLIVTSDNRWFASGSDGFYQIDPSGTTQPRKIPIALDANAIPSTENKAFFWVAVGTGVTSLPYRDRQIFRAR